jgi:glucokinase
MTGNGDDAALVVGVDLGGTKIEAALVDAGGRIVTSQRRATQAERGFDRVIDNVAACVGKCLDKASGPVRGVGIGVAGQIERDSGVIQFAPNLMGWSDLPIKARLETALALPVVVVNDVRAATYGEWRYGAGQGTDDLVCCIVGTGIGGGVVTGGRLLEGCHNIAGELGHMTIVAGGRQCHCRNQGCFEAYAGGWGIEARTREVISDEPEFGKRLIELAGSIEAISAATVTASYLEGDPLARRIVAETGHYLAAGLVGIINIFNPCLLILGGGVIDGLPEYIALAEPEIRRHILGKSDELRIVTTALGNKSAVIGAAALARSCFGPSTDRRDDVNKVKGGISDGK